jgi:hypothetical protein
MARLTEYNFELCKEICDKLANGNNIIRILKSETNYPTWSTFRRWKNDNNELQTLYVKAQQDKAMSIENKLDDLEDLLMSKEIDPSTYNTLAQTQKWKMAKFYPKVFGDRIQHANDPENPITNESIDYSKLSTQTLLELENARNKSNKGNS